MERKTERVEEIKSAIKNVRKKEVSYEPLIKWQHYPSVQ